MRTIKLLLAGFCLVFLAAGAGLAQTYDISWFSIDGGGGTSTGGNYSLSGTIGQPDAGTLSGGNYTITGGFWSAIAAVSPPTPQRPQLTVTVSGKSVIISWPSPSTGFTLQENGDLRTTTWTAPAQTVTDNGTTKSITISTPTGNKFYRLKY